ncbi:hypothetical protein LTR37_009778 [Vermiconidia calcicola]|uniref:Uncharacterized protein n=1 Tax=Vermiconidia calcicola TaxID=1690605 RepID=A0ACC3N6M2_9PEZI|nr:hypothetical protein LTR37_009778 [Vermiconidia calcicola]
MRDVSEQEQQEQEARDLEAYGDRLKAITGDPAFWSFDQEVRTPSEAEEGRSSSRVGEDPGPSDEDGTEGLSEASGVIEARKQQQSGSRPNVAITPHEEVQFQFRTRQGAIPPQPSSSSLGSAFTTQLASKDPEQDRRDSSAVQPSTQPATDLQQRINSFGNRVSILDVPRATSPQSQHEGGLELPSYAQAAADSFPATSADLTSLSLARDQKDNASISTSSSQQRRARLSFELNESKKSWQPFQSKSPASVGLSAGQGVVRKLNLGEAVSSPVTWSRSGSQQSGPRADGVDPFVEGASAAGEKSGARPKIKGILRRTSMDDQPDLQLETPSREKRKTDLEALFTPLTPKDAYSSASMRRMSSGSGEVRDTLDLASSAATSTPMDIAPRAVGKENAPAQPTASVSVTGPSSSLIQQYKLSVRHKRSGAVDLGYLWERSKSSGSVRMDIDQIDEEDEGSAQEESSRSTPNSKIKIGDTYLSIPEAKKKVKRTGPTREHIKLQNSLSETLKMTPVPSKDVSLAQKQASGPELQDPRPPRLVSASETSEQDREIDAPSTGSRLRREQKRVQRRSHSSESVPPATELQRQSPASGSQDLDPEALMRELRAVQERVYAQTASAVQGDGGGLTRQSSKRRKMSASAEREPTAMRRSGASPPPYYPRELLPEETLEARIENYWRDIKRESAARYGRFRDMYLAAKEAESAQGEVVDEDIDAKTARVQEMLKRNRKWRNVEMRRLVRKQIAAGIVSPRGWFARSPDGDETYLTEEGQRVGARLMQAKAEKAGREEAELEAESQRLFDDHIAGYNRATDESPSNNTAAFGESIVKSKGKKREVEGTGKDTTSTNSPDGVQQLQGEHRDSVVETKQNFGEAAPSIAPLTACEGEPTDLDRTKSHESTAGSDSSSSSGSSTQTAFRVGINSPPLTAIEEEDAPPS